MAKIVLSIQIKLAHDIMSIYFETKVSIGTERVKSHILGCYH